MINHVNNPETSETNTLLSTGSVIIVIMIWIIAGERIEIE